MAFESASVRLATPGAHVEGLMFMVGLSKQVPPRGLLTMTGPLAPFIVFAYGVEDEVEARAMRARLPEWAQRNLYTVVARPPQAAPTQEELRLTVRNLLEERFAVRAHRESHTGTVSVLVEVRPGTNGPGLRRHAAADACLPRSSNAEPTPEQPASTYCGLDLHTAVGGLLHVSMVDVTLPEACTLLGGLGGVLGGRGMDEVVDGTGLQGKWDITLEFAPERNGPADPPASGDVDGPSFSGALEKQLGLRLRRSPGTVEDLIVDHIEPPAAD